MIDSVIDSWSGMRESLEDLAEISCPSCGSPHLPLWRKKSWWKALFRKQKSEWVCEDCGLSGEGDADNWWTNCPKGAVRIWDEDLYRGGNVPFQIVKKLKW